MQQLTQEVDFMHIPKEIDVLSNTKLFQDHRVESSGDLDNLIKQKEQRLRELQAEVEELRGWKWKFCGVCKPKHSHGCSRHYSGPSDHRQAFQMS
jgi:hypothetical protein